MWYRRVLTENTLYSSDFYSVTILLGIVALIVAVFFFRERNGRRKLPPGPRGLPVLGYYPFLGKYPERTLKQVGQKYGNVFGFYMGPQYIVFLNDWTAVKDALKQDSTLDRPESFFGDVPYKLGVAGINGPEWHATRRLSTRVIKDIGLNRSGWEDLIKEEALDLVNRIAKERESAIDVRSVFQESFANNVVTLILGERLYLGHPVTKMTSKAVDAILQNTTSMSMRNFSPTLYKLLLVLGVEKQLLSVDTMNDFGKFISDTVDDRLRNHLEESEDSFIGRYLSEILNQKKDRKGTNLTVDNMKGDVIAMLAGGGETVRTSLIWTLIALADHPDEQRKVHEELDAVIGREGSFRWEDRNKVPYTYATLLESLRWTTIAPIPVFRKLTEDSQIQGYHIPKGTFIATNIWAMHNDPKYWKNPEEFRPERFLLDGGKKVNTSPDSFMAFSYGKRNCPGRLVAHMVGLLFLIAIMQKFEVKPKEGKRVKYDVIYGLSYQATNVEMRFVPR